MNPGAPSRPIGSIDLDREVVTRFAKKHAAMAELAKRSTREGFDRTIPGRMLLADPHRIGKTRAGRFSAFVSFRSGTTGIVF